MKRAEMIMVIEAHSEGKAIECTIKDNNEWSTTEHPEFNFMDCDYRVKPVPVYTVLGMSDIGVIVFGVDIRGSDKKFVEIKALNDALGIIELFYGRVLPPESMDIYDSLKELLK